MLNGQHRYAIQCAVGHEKSDVFAKTDDEARELVKKKGWQLFWMRSGEAFFPILVCKKCTKKLEQREEKT